MMGKHTASHTNDGKAHSITHKCCINCQVNHCTISSPPHHPSTFYLTSLTDLRGLWLYRIRWLQRQQLHKIGPALQRRWRTCIRISHQSTLGRPLSQPPTPSMQLQVVLSQNHLIPAQSSLLTLGLPSRGRSPTQPTPCFLYVSKEAGGCQVSRPCR